MRSEFRLGQGGGEPFNGVVREPPVLRQIDKTYVLHGTRRLSYFAGSDYLRLSWHADVRRAAVRGIREYGTGACASRMTTGNLPVYGELEAALEGFFGVGSATLTSAGYTAPLVVAQALAADHGVVLLDDKAHACLRDAAALTGLRVEGFRHGEPADLEARLQALKAGVRALVLVDGLNPLDGRVSPLEAYASMLGERGTLVVDDAHGAGVLGVNGRGSVEWAGMAWRRVVVTLTLSKAFGSYGGVVLGDRRVRARILERSRLFTGNTPPAPSTAAAALGSLAVMAREGGALRDRLRANVERIPEALRRSGAACAAGPGPMFLVAPRTAARAERLRRSLLDAGIYPPLIEYPNGPAPRYFRFAISSAHTAAQVRDLAEVLETFSGKDERSGA